MSGFGKFEGIQGKENRDEKWIEKKKWRKIKIRLKHSELFLDDTLNSIHLFFLLYLKIK